MNLDRLKLFLFVINFNCLISLAKSKITIDQVNKSAQLMRSVCQPKFQITDEQIEMVRAGNFPENNKNLKCYTNCIMEIMQSIKKGKLQYEASLRQIEILLPDDYKEPYRNALEICRKSGVGIKDNCEAAYTIAKCFYANNPMFIYP